LREDLASRLRAHLPPTLVREWSDALDDLMRMTD
jgi:hypothetical protein